MAQTVPPSESAPSAPRLGRVVIALVLGALVVHALWAASRKVTCDDMWWDLAAGRYIVEHGSVPEGDVFSYTHAGDRWHNGEWLANVALYVVYERLGASALAGMKFAVVVAVLLLATWTAWRRSDSPLLAIVAAVLATYVIRPYIDIRSQLFQFLSVAAAMAVIEAYRRGSRAWVLALLPVLMMLWVNLHYSFLFGCGVLGLYAACELGKAWLHLPDRPLSYRRARFLAVAAAVSILAALMNPYFTRAFTFPFSLVGAEALWRQDVLEWQPPVFFVEGDLNPALFGYFFVLQVAAAMAALISDRRRFDLTDVALVAVTAAFALSSRRFIPLLVVVSIPFLAKNLAVVCDRLRGAFAPLQPASLAGVCTALLAGGLSALLLYRAVPEAEETFAPGFFEGVTGTDYFPVSAVEFLRLNPLPARLFHPYTWGGYVMFQLPERQVFIDGRANTVYHADFYVEDQIAENGRPGWSRVLDGREVSLVLWPSSSAHGERYAPTLQHLAASPDWVRIYDDGHSAIFAHAERGRAWVDAFRRFALEYPENGNAQLFLANAYLAANAFVPAREHLLAVLQRFPKKRDTVQQLERKLAEAARIGGSPQSWFGAGFFRDLLGDSAGAAAAFREALGGGLADPGARLYAQQALERLTSAAPAQS